MPEAVLSCPKCSKRLAIKGATVGSIVTCPGCSSAFRLDEEPTPVQAQPPTPSPRPSWLIPAVVAVILVLLATLWMAYSSWHIQWERRQAEIREEMLKCLVKDLYESQVRTYGVDSPNANPVKTSLFIREYYRTYTNKELYSAACTCGYNGPEP